VPATVWGNCPGGTLESAGDSTVRRFEASLRGITGARKRVTEGPKLALSCFPVDTGFCPG